MINQKVLPVKDNKDLVRDTYSKAILSNNKNALEEHRKKKDFMKKMLSQTEEIASMKDDINEIKRLLSEFIKTDK